MPSDDYLSYFLGGAFLAHALPYLVVGISRRPNQRPFAKTPYVSNATPAFNVSWGIVELGLAYVLLCHRSSFSLHNPYHVLALSFGILVMSLMFAFVFVRSHRRSLK